jgi:hypothetical protein
MATSRNASLFFAAVAILLVSVRRFLLVIFFSVLGLFYFLRGSGCESLAKNDLRHAKTISSTQLGQLDRQKTSFFCGSYN